MKKPNGQLRYHRKQKGWSQRRLGEEIGTDQNMVSRWECGTQDVSPYYQTRLIELFGKNAEELGFLQPPSPAIAQALHNESQFSIQGLVEYDDSLISIAQAASQDIIGEENLEGLHLNKPRRQLIQNALGIGTVRIAPFDVLSYPLVLDRLSRVLTESINVDQITLLYLETLTSRYWQDRHGAVVASSNLLGYVVEHLQRIIAFLERSLLPDGRKRLCSIASGTAQLVGHLLFDLRDFTNARHFHHAAIKAAQEANNPALEAVAWGRMSFTWTYNGEAQKALTCIQRARLIDVGEANNTVQAYLAGIEAEIQANLGQRDACLSALDSAESFIGLSQNEESNYWLRFDSSRLAGYQGACFRRLYNPKDAQTIHFLSKAQKTLQDSLSRLSPSMLQRRPVLLIDVASVYAQQGEIGEAYKYVLEAVPLIQQINSKSAEKRLLEMRANLDARKYGQDIKNMDDCIAALIK